jgi:hypothetical protein
MGNAMKPFAAVSLLLALIILPGCIHALSLRSPDGEILRGRYRFARGNTGLMQVTRANGEVLSGKFTQVGRTAFVERYEKTFGRGSISVAGLDASPYGHLSGGPFASSYGLTGSAYREAPADAPRDAVAALRGPLFYWMALLRGNRGTTMECYLIGSSYTNHGFGSCRSHAGEEYNVDF